MPLEQLGEVAEATYCTGDVLVDPLAGLLIVIVANRGVDIAAERNRAKRNHFIKLVPICLAGLADSA